MNETRASVEDFDLRRHAVVEASAGTGKTYTIEQLVLRLLVEENYRLEQILVVTFTEKATGELKVRLRSMLERELQKNDGEAANLKSALDEFDQAPIYTIHGFCQRLSQDYSLEQGRDFHADLANDLELMRTLLCEVQRKFWRAEFGAQLKAVLDAAGFNRNNASRWEDTVLSLAIRYKPSADHRLYPPPVEDWWRRLSEADSNWGGQLEIFTINKLHELLREHKRQRGLQSFDDMIAAVEESVDPAKNQDAESFLNVLRERYRCGIVDEFQDTDPLQWNIFRRIFLTGGSSKLFIVGDPKQAIYGFRGSDLPTYHRAAKEMTTQHGAATYQLPTNWRSEPELLDALNCLFGDGDWFPRGGAIKYVYVHPPDDDRRLTRTEVDRTDRAALTMVDLSSQGTPKKAQKLYARFVAQEIRRLLGNEVGESLLTFVHKNETPRPINAGDVCILVMKRAETEVLISALDAVGVPYNFYKQTGLWQTNEAVHLEVLLQILARPEDRTAFRKALLTFFFRIRPNQLSRSPDLPTQHPARALFQRWLGFVEQRQWSSLCRSVIEDTGLLFASFAAADRPNLTTLRNLLAALEQAAHGANLDMMGVLDWLKKLREQRDATDADLVPVETGRDKVKIMTIHAAKGLEFPVVFLAGGFAQSSTWLGPVAYRDEEGHLVFAVRADEEAMNRARRDQLDEQRRQLYVALTRPILKLYVPKVKIPSNLRHVTGPLGTILLPALEQACPDKLGPLVAESVTPPLAMGVQPLASAAAPIAAMAPPIAVASPLFLPRDRQLGKRRIFVRSFSSMARHHLSPVGEGAIFGEDAPLAADEAAVPVDQEDPLRGPVFGDMVHKVLEEIDFAEVGRAPTPNDLCLPGSHARQCLDRIVQADIAQLRTRTPAGQLEEAARRQIAHLIWHALKTPLAALGGPLCEIAKADRLHEVEFLFPEQRDARAEQGRREDGFITGFMDLLFRKNKRCYLLDWKTNFLSGYGREQIEKSMAESDYHRQYRLYLHAASRWLERMHKSPYSFRERFGGVYYLYLRGMNGRDESTGVFFRVPTEQDLELDAILR